MESRDILVTPILILLVYLVAYIVRPRVTDMTTRVYFFPAITVKIMAPWGVVVSMFS